MAFKIVLNNLPKAWNPKYAINDNGDIYLTYHVGTTGDYQDYKTTTIKYTSSGSLLWQKDLTITSNTTVSGIALAGSGGVVIVGTDDARSTWNKNGQSRHYIAKYNSNGDLEWTRRSDRTAGGNLISISNDGSIYISAGNYLYKYDESGKKLWDIVVDFKASRLATDQNGNLYSVNNTYARPSYSYSVSKVSKYGVVEWTKEIGNSSNNISVRSIDVGKDGSIYVGGKARDGLHGEKSTLNGDEGYVSKIDSQGEIKWTRFLGTSATNGPGIIHIQDNGNILISNKLAYAGKAEMGSQEATSDTYIFHEYTQSGSKVKSRKAGPFTTKFPATDSRQVWSKPIIGENDKLYLEFTQVRQAWGNSYNRKFFQMSLNEEYSITPEYTISAYADLEEWSPGVDNTVVEEGGGIKLSIRGTNVSSGSNVYWKIHSADPGITASDFQPGSTSGIATFGNTEYINLDATSIKSDEATEGEESFKVQLYSDANHTNLVSSSNLMKIADTSTTPPPTYSLSSSSKTVDEGETHKTTVATTNLASGTILYWAISGSSVNKTDFSSGSLLGSCSIDKSGICSISNSLANDNLTEGDESFDIRLYTDFDRTNLVATSPTVTISDNSATTSPTYSVSTAPSSVNEGAPLTTTISTTGLAFGTILYWAISGRNVQKEDFSTGTLSGSGTVDKSGSFSFSHSLSKDNLQEGDESFVINLFSDANGTTKLASSSIISIRDISTDKETHTQAPVPTQDPTPISSSKPTPETTSAPVSEPASEPASEPTSAPVSEPASEPASEPTPAYGLITAPEQTLTSDPPNLLTAIARGGVITLQFDNILSSTIPSSTRFSLFQGNKQYQVIDTEIKPIDGVVKLFLAKKFDPTAKLTLNYLDFTGDQTQGIIESATGVDLESFAGFNLNNQGTQDNELTIDEGEYEGNQITLFLSAPISKAIPKTSRFIVKSANNKHRILGVSTEPDEGIIKIKTKKNLDLQESIFVSYRDLGGDQVDMVIEDLAGNDMVSIRNYEIVSGGNDAVAPIVASAFLDKNILSVEFDSIIRNTSISKNRFKVKVDGKRVRVLTANVEQDDSYVDLKLQPKKFRNIDTNSSVTLAYKDPKGDQTSKVVEDLFGNDLDSFSGYGVEIIKI